MATCRDDTRENTLPICSNWVYDFHSMKRSIEEKIEVPSRQGLDFCVRESIEQFTQKRRETQVTT